MRSIRGRVTEDGDDALPGDHIDRPMRKDIEEELHRARVNAMRERGFQETNEGDDE